MTEIEYYMPVKEETDSIPDLQYRPIVQWMNEVFFEGFKFRLPIELFPGLSMSKSILAGKSEIFPDFI
jgi:hypothetical protein